MAESQFAADELTAEEEKSLREFDDAPPAKEEAKPDEVAPAAEPVEQAAESAATEQPRAADGKFAGKDGEEKGEAQKRLVPLPELLEERKARQATEREFAEFKGKTEERLRAIAERFAPKEQPKPVSVEEQPIEVLKEIQGKIKNYEDRQQVEQQINQFSGYVADQVHQFRTSTPDYDAALQHARGSRLGELKLMGLNDAQARQQLALDEFSFAQSTIQAGKNVGQALYEYAALRGYKKAEAAPPAAATGTPTAVEKLATIAQGQQKAKSLGGAGGSAQDATLTMERLLEMTNEQFAAVPEQELRRLMGG